uniref:Anaphase-promoting complex subunit 1 middle domain-containing protein n=1 Tax=Ciona savignyi TaxID=51511 RepID=H2Y7X7_CIOSA
MATMEEVGLLSPVPELEYTGNDISILTGDEFAFSTSGISSRLIGLPHVVGSTLILEVTGGANYRADVPQLCTSELVNTCMRALQFVLPNDTYLSYATKWYSFRHAPGALNGRNVEWTLFVECLQDFLGYVGISSWRFRHSAIQDSMEFDVSSSPVIAAKKLRHSDQLDAKDWEFMTSSKYNKCMENTDDDDSQCIEDSIVYQGNSHSWSNYRRHSLDSSLAGDSMQASNQPLMSVFSVLHLVYEEQKLNTILWPNVEKMASFLYRLASDLNLPKYCYSYALDCPILMKKFLSSKMHIALDSEEQEIRSLLSSGADQEPHIYANLHQLTRGKPLNCPFPYIPNVTVRIERILKVRISIITLW